MVQGALLRTKKFKAKKEWPFIESQRLKHLCFIGHYSLLKNASSMLLRISFSSVFRSYAKSGSEVISVNSSEAHMGYA